MKDLNINKTCDILNSIMEYELSGVVRYTHSSMMVRGPHRLPIVQFLQAQANESLVHAQEAGELLTGLEGHPTQQIAPIEETHQHSVNDILQESLEHELHAIELYNHLLETVDGKAIFLEEYARNKIGQEEQHSLELRKMLRDYSS